MASATGDYKFAYNDELHDQDNWFSLRAPAKIPPFYLDYGRNMEGKRKRKNVDKKKQKKKKNKFSVLEEYPK
jgi:hypothetical protein